MKRRKTPTPETVADDIREMLRRSREAQGLPPTITDEATLARVQALLDHTGGE